MTGAGAGIGEATAERLADEGATLFLTDRVEEGLTSVAERFAAGGVTVETAVADVSIEADWIRVVAGPYASRSAGSTCSSTTPGSARSSG